MSAVLKTTDPTPAVLKRYGYAFDKAGNRTAEQIDDAVTGATYDAMNRLTSQQPGGALTIRGSVNETASVTVNGAPATVTAAGAFDTQVPVSSATSNVEIKATDPSGNLRTSTYEVTQSGASKNFTYDANGSMTSDGTRTFAWDAENRLVSVTQGTLASEFTYDGLGRRVRIVEKDNGVTTSDKRFLWCGLSICEERDSTGATVTKRYFGQGVYETAGGGASFFYSRDHLGSIREVTDSLGAVRARYDYDPWGRRTKLSGDKDADFGFTGHYEHVPTGLTLAPYRAYDAGLGKWISEDPSGLQDGFNLFTYVANGSTGWVDASGLGKMRPVKDHPNWTYRHDYPAGDGDKPHTQYENRGKPIARRVYPDGTQKPHGDGIDKDVPEDVINDTPPHPTKPKPEKKPQDEQNDETNICEKYPTLCDPMGACRSNPKTCLVILVAAAAAVYACPPIAVLAPAF